MILAMQNHHYSCHYPPNILQPPQPSQNVRHMSLDNHVADHSRIASNISQVNNISVEERIETEVVEHIHEGQIFLLTVPKNNRTIHALIGVLDEYEMEPLQAVVLFLNGEIRSHPNLVNQVCHLLQRRLSNSAPAPSPLQGVPFIPSDPSCPSYHHQCPTSFTSEIEALSPTHPTIYQKVSPAEEQSLTEIFPASEYNPNMHLVNHSSISDSTRLTSALQTSRSSTNCLGFAPLPSINNLLNTPGRRSAIGPYRSSLSKQRSEYTYQSLHEGNPEDSQQTPSGNRTLSPQINLSLIHHLIQSPQRYIEKQKILFQDFEYEIHQIPLVTIQDVIEFNKQVFQKLSGPMIDLYLLYPNYNRPNNRRYDYEFECNQIGLAYLYYNSEVLNKKGILQKIVDRWRNSNPDVKIRSRSTRKKELRAGAAKDSGDVFQTVT